MSDSARGWDYNDDRGKNDASNSSSAVTGDRNGDDITANDGNTYHYSRKKKNNHNNDHPQINGTSKALEGDGEGEEEKGDDEQIRDANTKVAADKPSAGFYQCSTCKKTYNRADHLIRHVRSHTHEKPYVCDTCGKGFARPDLLKRHAAGHEDNNNIGNDNNGTEKSSTDSKKRKIVTAMNGNDGSGSGGGGIQCGGRVTQACKACAASKLKCSEGKPCERCGKKRLVCEEASAGEEGAKGNEESQGVNGAERREGSDKSTAAQSEQSFIPSKETETSASSSTKGSASRSEGVLADGVLECNGSYFPEFLRHVVAEPGSMEVATGVYSPANFNQSFFPQNYVYFGTEEHGDSWCADLWYSDSLQDAFNMPFESTFTPYAPTMSNSSEGSSLAGVGADAFKHSLIGSWTPRPEDSSLMESQNLVAPKNIDTMQIFTESKHILPEPLSLNARDRILGMVLETCPQAAASHIIASFPSADFLTNCIQYYFCRRHEEQIDSYIHLPTLDPNHQRAELLAMLAGAGAVCTASSVVRKLGYALQESVRYAIQKRVGSFPALHLTG